jgi:hypothetical protein
MKASHSATPTFWLLLAEVVVVGAAVAGAFLLVAVAVRSRFVVVSDLEQPKIRRHKTASIRNRDFDICFSSVQNDFLTEPIEKMAKRGNNTLGLAIFVDKTSIINEIIHAWDS